MENKNKTPFEESLEDLSKEQLTDGEPTRPKDNNNRSSGSVGVKALLVCVCAAIFIYFGILLITQLKDQSSTNRQKDDAAKIYKDMANQMQLYGEGDKTETVALSPFENTETYISSTDFPEEKTSATESSASEQETSSLSESSSFTESVSESSSLATETATETQTETETETSSIIATETETATETASETQTETETETDSETQTETETETTVSITETQPASSSETETSASSSSYSTSATASNEYLMPDTPPGTWLSSMPIPNATIVRDSNSTIFVNSSKGLLIALQKRYQNPDIVAYLSIGKVGATGRIENPTIEGAVTIHSDNDLYLDHDLYQNSNANGALFIDCDCDVNLLNNHNTIIYGHHLSTGSTQAIFGHLDSFRNLDYFMNNNEVTVQMADAVYYYNVVMCATVDYDPVLVSKYSYAPMLLYNIRYKNTDDYFSAYRRITSDFERLGKIKVIRYTGWTTAFNPDLTLTEAQSNLNDGEKLKYYLDEGDRFLTLSTCYGELGTSARCILICKLTKVLLASN